MLPHLSKKFARSNEVKMLDGADDEVAVIEQSRRTKEARGSLSYRSPSW